MHLVARHTRTTKGDSMAKSKSNTRTAFLAAPNAADASRIIGKDGKAFRTHLRKLGKYASKGTGWANMSAKERADVYAHFVPAPKIARAPKAPVVDVPSEDTITT